MTYPDDYPPIKVNADGSVEFPVRHWCALCKPPIFFWSIEEWWDHLQTEHRREILKGWAKYGGKDGLKLSMNEEWKW